MKKSFLCTLCIVTLSFIVAGCKSSQEEPADKTVKLRHLTITEQSGAASPRRIINATITDEGSTLSASWDAGNNLSYCNLSRHSDESHYDTELDENVYDLYTGSLTAEETASISQLSGDVECMADDYLAVVYPQNNTFDFDEPNKYSYTFSLTGQDGTLDKLATTFHQCYGRAHVTSVTDKDASATMPKMKSLLTICKFSFKIKDTETIIPVKTLKIAYKTDDSNNGKYPHSAKVTVESTTEHANVHAVSETLGDDGLTIDCGSSPQNAVYVAMLPTSLSRTYTFTVTNDNGTYSGEASALLKEGEFVPATGLKLVKQ